MSNNKKHEEKRKRERAKRNAARKRIKHSRKFGGPRDLPEALHEIEDRRNAIQSGWDHI